MRIPGFLVSRPDEDDLYEQALLQGAFRKAWHCWSPEERDAFYRYQGQQRRYEARLERWLTQDRATRSEQAPALEDSDENDAVEATDAMDCPTVQARRHPYRLLRLTQPEFTNGEIVAMAAGIAGLIIAVVWQFLLR